MAQDLDRIFRNFPYEAGRVNARVVRSIDGREVVQVRIELGILQMESGGRPDGQPLIPLDIQSRHGRVMTPQEAAHLRLEMVQFQQRAIAFMAIGDAQRAVRDADRLLASAAVLAEAAPESEAEWANSARFAAIVLRTRAAAAMLAMSGRGREAGSVIDAGLELLREAAERSGIGDHFEHLGDTTALRALRDTLVPQLPPAQRSELDERLRAALRAENYELAAILRDELRLM